MSKERLEEIRNEIERSNNTRKRGNTMGAERMILDLHETGRFEWLVKYAKEQAERVQGLEDAIKGAKVVCNIATEEKKKFEQQNKRYREVIKYIKYAIYTQLCTKKHMENTEYEKGEISGLTQASNIVEKALRKLEGESNELE